MSGPKAGPNDVKARDRIQAVTFDAGGTLFKPWPSVGHVYARVAAAHGGLELAPESLNERFARAWRARKNFGYSLGEWAGLVDATFAGLVVRPPSESFFPALYEEFARGNAWRVFEDARPALRRVRAMGLKIAVISNWDERLRPLLAELELGTEFDAVVVSGEEGVHKPARAIFAAAARRLGVSESAILHVGDSRVEDYEGALAAGCHALLLDRAQTRGGGAIASLLDVLDWRPA